MEAKFLWNDRKIKISSGKVVHCIVKLRQDDRGRVHDTDNCCATLRVLCVHILVSSVSAPLPCLLRMLQRLLLWPSEREWRRPADGAGAGAGVGVGAEATPARGVSRRDAAAAAGLHREPQRHAAAHAHGLLRAVPAAGRRHLLGHRGSRGGAARPRVAPPTRRLPAPAPLRARWAGFSGQITLKPFKYIDPLIYTVFPLLAYFLPLIICRSQDITR